MDEKVRIMIKKPKKILKWLFPIWEYKALVISAFFVGYMFSDGGMSLRNLWNYAKGTFEYLINEDKIKSSHKNK